MKRPTKLSKGKKRFVTRLYDGMLKVCVCERERERGSECVMGGGEKKRKSFRRDLALFGRTLSSAPSK